MPVSETAELVDRCRQGDDLAWERLVRTFQGRVYALAYHYVRDADAARDLAQEIFVRVYQKYRYVQRAGIPPLAPAPGAQPLH